jgi:hypothetical protein
MERMLGRPGGRALSSTTSEQDERPGSHSFHSNHTTLQHRTTFLVPCSLQRDSGGLKRPWFRGRVVPRSRGCDDSDHALRTIHLTGQTHATCSQARLGTTNYDVATACKKAARPLGILHQTLRRLPAFDAWALPHAPPPTTTLTTHLRGAECTVLS